MLYISARDYYLYNASAAFELYRVLDVFIFCTYCVSLLAEGGW